MVIFLQKKGDKDGLVLSFATKHYCPPTYRLTVEVIFFQLCEFGTAADLILLTLALLVEARALRNIFHELNSKKSEFYVLGDFNIDQIKIKSNNRIKTYADDLIGSAVECLINQPTRVCKNSKSLLDHIYSNNLNNQLMPGIAISDISDHYPVFALIPSAKHFKNNARQV